MVNSNRQRALRHVVYRDLMQLLPYASADQADAFAANLAMFRKEHSRPDVYRRRMPADVEKRLFELKVTPDINETERTTTAIEIVELCMNFRYGERLRSVAGFYSRGPVDNGRPFAVNLPRRCALLPYTDAEGYLTGIVCQPLAMLDRYWLLSSSKFGGAKATPMRNSDREFLDRFTLSVEPIVASPKQVTIANFSDYCRLLKEAREERRAARKTA